MINPYEFKPETRVIYTAIAKILGFLMSVGIWVISLAILLHIILCCITIPDALLGNSNIILKKYESSIHIAKKILTLSYLSRENFLFILLVFFFLCFLKKLLSYRHGIYRDIIFTGVQLGLISLAIFVFPIAKDIVNAQKYLQHYPDSSLLFTLIIFYITSFIIAIPFVLFHYIENSKNVLKARWLCKKAYQCILQQNYEQARSLLNSSLRHNPIFIKALILMAELEIQDKNFQKANATYKFVQKILSQYPKNEEKKRVKERLQKLRKKDFDMKMLIPKLDLCLSTKEELQKESLDISKLQQPCPFYPGETKTCIVEYFDDEQMHIRISKNTLDVFEEVSLRLVRGKHRFNLYMEKKEIFQVGKISEELQEVFKKNGVALSDAAEIKKRMKDNWIITDGKNKYEVFIENNTIRIHEISYVLLTLIAIVSLCFYKFWFLLVPIALILWIIFHKNLYSEGAKCCKLSFLNYTMRIAKPLPWIPMILLSIWIAYLFIMYSLPVFMLNIVYMLIAPLMMVMEKTIMGAEKCIKLSQKEFSVEILFGNLALGKRISVENIEHLKISIIEETEMDHEKYAIDIYMEGSKKISIYTSEDKELQYWLLRVMNYFRAMNEP